MVHSTSSHQTIYPNSTTQKEKSSTEQSKNFNHLLETEKNKAPSHDEQIKQYALPNNMTVDVLSTLMTSLHKMGQQEMEKVSPFMLDLFSPERFEPFSPDKTVDHHQFLQGMHLLLASPSQVNMSEEMKNSLHDLWNLFQSEYSPQNDNRVSSRLDFNPPKR